MSAVIERTDDPVVVQESATAIMQVIERAALNPAIDVEKMERLFALQERMLARNAEADFNVSMTACQEEMRRVSADAINPQTKSEYATYGKLDRVLRPIYTKQGFSLTFSDGETTKPDYVRVVCLVRHRSGHKETHWKDMPADGKGAKGGDVMTKTHAAGAAQQYGMRYLLKGIFNVAIGEDDNDGNTELDCITESQVTDLMALADEVKADRQKFLAYMKVEKLSDISAKDYSKAVAALQAKRGR